MMTLICDCGYTIDNRRGMSNHKRHCAIYKSAKKIPIKPLKKTILKKGGKDKYEAFRVRHNKVAYCTIHSWIRRRFGNAKKCDDCGKTKIPSTHKIFFHWANISGKYKKDIKDWKQLCLHCHSAFDGVAKLSKSQVADIRNTYDNGTLTANELGVKYSVGKSTIFRIVRNQIPVYEY